MPSRPIAQLPVYRFVYAYETTGDLADETIEVDAVTERAAYEIARRKVDRVSTQIGLRLLSSEPTGSVRSHRHDFRDGDVCSTCDSVRA